MAHSSVFLGIDVGTGGTRALVIDAAGRLVGSATAEHVPFASPRPGWAEQDPDDWWRATGEAVRGALARGRPRRRRIAGGRLLRADARLDAARRARRGRAAGAALVRPAHQRRVRGDHRAHRRRPPDRAHLEPGAHRLHAAQAALGATHEPERWARVRSVLLPKDYVRFRLTGDRATDVADASGTLLFDVTNRRWSAEVAAALDIDLVAPAAGLRVARGHRPVSAAGAAATGLRAGTPVVAGGGDQAAGAVGMGIVAAGPRQRHHRHVGRRLCGDRPAGARSERPGPHLLPRRPRMLARDGRDPGRRAVAALVPRHVRRRREAAIPTIS